MSTLLAGSTALAVAGGGESARGAKSGATGTPFRGMATGAANGKDIAAAWAISAMFCGTLPAGSKSARRAVAALAMALMLMGLKTFHQFRH